MYNKIHFKNKYLRYGIPIAFLVFFAYIFFSRSKLKSDYFLTNATVTSVGKTMSKDGNWLIEYRYLTAEGEVMKSEGYYPVFLPQGKNMVNHSIPVAYSPKDPKTNQLLIYKQTWEQYGLKYPDSLNWLRKYIDFKKVIYSY